MIEDLRFSAANALDAAGGHSYENWGWMNGSCIYPDGRLIDGNLQPPPRWAKVQHAPHMLKTERTVKKPFQTFIVLDSDQGGGSNPGDPHNN